MSNVIHYFNKSYSDHRACDATDGSNTARVHKVTCVDCLRIATANNEPPGFSIDANGIAHRGPVPPPAPVPPPVPEGLCAVLAALSCRGAVDSDKVADRVWTWLATNGYLAQPGQADDGWVFVEQQPVAWGWYLTYTGAGPVMPAYWNRDEQLWLASSDLKSPILRTGITHWRPLPAPPKGDADDATTR